MSSVDFIDIQIRGKFILDNERNLVTRIKKGENIKWIASYLYANPGVGAHECKRALLSWRGFKMCDQSRGQYASYFYDYYAKKWYFNKLWTVEKFNQDGPKKMILRSEGMGRVDLQLAEKIKQWDGKAGGIVDNSLAGKNYDNIFPGSFKNANG